MGYVHDTHASVFIPPAAIQKTAGTWTPTIASNLVSDVRSAADASFTILVPVTVPQNSSFRKGARLKSIDLFYKITTAADDVASVALDKVTLPATVVAAAGTSITAITLDTGHDTAAERKAQGDHTLTVTLDTPAWVGSNDIYWLSMVVDAAATTAFVLFGARANFDQRI
jgi:hypothetical protein